MTYQEEIFFFFIKENSYKIYKIVKIKKKDNSYELYSKLILGLESFYTYPIDSSFVGIFTSKKCIFEPEIRKIAIESVSGKICHFIDNEINIYIPLIHFS